MSWFSDGFRSVGRWIGDRVEQIGNWIGGGIDAAWNWMSENVSGMPLKFFSAMGSVFGGTSMMGREYFLPKHADNDVNALMSGSKWDAGSITYSLPDSRWDYEWLNPSATGFERLSASTEAAVDAIMRSVDHLIGNAVTYAGRNDADIKVAGFQPGSIIQRSHGYYPGVPTYGGDTWLTTGDRQVGLKGSHNYFLTMHEIGHSLGLKHPHDSATGLPRMSAWRDSTEFSVMSYNETWDRPQSFMQYDIAALQYMYGADFQTNAGNTTYRWDPTTGEMSINGVGQGKTNESKIFLTIWDGGGVDTYDFSNFTDNAVIDLSPGGISKVSEAQRASGGWGWKVGGNVYNAFQYQGSLLSLIENAKGGSGSDIITGNTVRNELSGNAGHDYIRGLAGNDTLYGNAGDDYLDGGLNEDWLEGGDGADRLIGAGGWDTLLGGNGNDTLEGGDLDDIILGGAGADRLSGGQGLDMFRFAGPIGIGEVDLITDFTAGGDILQLDRATFRAFASEGQVLDKHIAIGRTATSADQRLVYDAGTGAVFYDADGLGGAAQVQFATLLTRPATLRAKDFGLIWA